MKRYGRNSVGAFSGNYLNLVAMMCLIFLIAICGCKMDYLDQSELPALRVNPTSLTLSVGETKTVDIGGGVYPYRISSANASVAQIVLKDSVVNVTGVGQGTTAFTIYNSESSQNSDESIAVSVTVTGVSYSLSDTGNKVVLGPVENADVAVYRLSDLKNVIETTRTGEKGAFALNLSDIDDSELLLVSATGGQDIDADDDGIADQTPTPNTGTIHALATAKDIRDGKLTVSLISEMAWQYSKNQIGDTHPEDLKIRLRDISRVIFKERIDNTSDVFQDITKFNPLSKTHRDKLNFDYANILKENSLLDTIHKGPDVSVIQGAVEPVIGNALSFNDGKSQASRYAKIRLLPFGQGKVSASSGNIGYDAKNRTKDSLSDFYLVGDVVTLRAESYEDTHIESWSGCDNVSDDKKQCSLTVLEDTMVGVNFASDKVVFSDKTLDLSNAITEIDTDETTYRIKANAGDAETANKLGSLKAENHIISTQEPFYAREVVNVSLSGDTYIVETKDVDITQVIQKGTGVLKKTLTHADLADFSTSSSTRSAKRSPYSEGDIRLLPPKDLNDDTFVFSFGEPQKKDTRGKVSADFEKGESVTLSKTFKTENGIEIVLSGSIEVKFNVDAGLEYEYFDVKAIKVIPSVTLKEEFGVTFKDKIDIFKGKVSLGTITFARQPIGMIGWITYDAELFLVLECGLEGKAEIKTKFTQTATGGVTWDENNGVKWITDFKKSWEPIEETITAQLKAKAYFEVAPSVLLYSTVGPSIPLKVGLSVSAGAKVKANTEEVSESLFAKAALFASAEGTITVREHFGLTWLANKVREKLESATKITILEEIEWVFKTWEIPLFSIKDQPSYLKISGEDAIYSVKSYEKDTLPDTIAEYTLTNTGNSDLSWGITTTGNDLFDMLAFEMPQKQTLASKESAVVKVVWKSGVSKQSLANRTFRGTITFTNKSRDTFPPFQTGTMQKQVRVTVEEGTPTAQSNLPGSVIVQPTIGIWDASPKIIQVSCPRAEKIYCIISVKTDDTMPDPIRSQPTESLHSSVNQKGDQYITGDSGQFEIWAEPNQVKTVKVIFRGLNKYGYGNASGVFTYTINQSGNASISCSYAINPTNSTLTSSGGTGGVSVTASGSCNWNASSNADWITIDSGASGNGNGTVSYSVAQNTGNTRTGTLSVAGQTVTVTQYGVSNGVDDVVNFPDKNLEAAIREAIKKPSGDILVSDLQGLTYLSCRGGSGRNIKNIEGIQYCMNLTSLDLMGNQIGDIGPLAGLKNLTSLTLLNNYEFRDISPLAGLNNLISLHITIYGNKLNDISAMAGLTNLTSLHLSLVQFKNISVLANFKKLTSLNLYGDQISDISVLANLTNLTRLELVGDQISNISPLAGLNNLTYLNLYGEQISDISVLADLKNLTGLYIGCEQISNISVLSGLTNLTLLAITAGQKLYDFSPISGLKNLTALQIQNNFSDISVLSQLTNLTYLNLERNQISDIVPLAGLTNLTELYLEGNQISDIVPLAGLINLRKLNLSYNKITDIKPLADNAGIDSGDYVELYGYKDEYNYTNQLNTTSCTVYIPQLQSRGVNVYHNCP